jgi:hypothetical protein
MDTNNFINLTDNILRSTGEKVEIVAFNNVEDGERNAGDWVTYIDSNGKEHIKEHLNIQLDFKPVTDDTFKKLLDISKVNKYPSVRNNRIFELTKELVKVNANYDGCVEIATKLVDKIGIEYNNDDYGNKKEG